MQYDQQHKVFKDSDSKEKKPQRYSQDSFVKELIGKTVKVTLINAQVISGRLLELGMFDIRLQTPESQIIVMKSGILTVQVMQ